MKTKAKHIPKKLTTIVYIVLLCFSLFLVVAKWGRVFNENFNILPDAINSHVSNFAISLIFYLVVGYAWLLHGVKFRPIAILGLAIIIANFICETLLSFVNTIDIFDAIAGSIGVIVAFAFLFLANKFGLQKKDKLHFPRK